jgi:hypothetical protein
MDMFLHLMSEHFKIAVKCHRFLRKSICAFKEKSGFQLLSLDKEQLWFEMMVVIVSPSDIIFQTWEISVSLIK